MCIRESYRAIQRCIRYMYRGEMKRLLLPAYSVTSLPLLNNQGRVHTHILKDALGMTSVNHTYVNSKYMHKLIPYLVDSHSLPGIQKFEGHKPYPVKSEKLPDQTYEYAGDE